MWLRFALINDTPVKLFNGVHPRHPMEVGKVEREVLKKYLVLWVVFKAIKSSMLVFKRMVGPQEEKLQY